jgi:hypothetical protein
MVDPDRLCECDEPPIVLFANAADRSGPLMVESVLPLLPEAKVSGVKGLFTVEALKLGFRECWSPCITEVWR